jgi:hypothetical protein
MQQAPPDLSPPRGAISRAKVSAEYSGQTGSLVMEAEAWLVNGTANAARPLSIVTAAAAVHTRARC